jgi:putative flippase GtrA
VKLLSAKHKKRRAGGLSAVQRFLSRHGFTFTSFTIVGALVFISGFAGLYVQVHWLGVNPRLAYVLQAIVSITLNFTLNWKWTWRERGVSFRAGSRRFLLTRLVTFPAHQIIYNVLISLGLEFLAASLATTALLTLFMYWVSDKWVFAAEVPAITLKEEP